LGPENSDIIEDFTLILGGAVEDVFLPPTPPYGGLKKKIRSKVPQMGDLGG